MTGCGYVGVDERWVKKNFVFGRNVLQIAIFRSFHSPYTLSTSKNTRQVGSS
jgi:hypothetical protein